jgi:glycosyltransferase involved in cell wall biosynthesis
MVPGQETRPLAFIQLKLNDGGLAATEIKQQIQAELPFLSQEESNNFSREGSDPLATPSTSSSLLVSVVIATHNRHSSLERTLESVLRQEYPNFEILLVDNAPSSDATLTLIQETPSLASRVHYLREETPGLAIAHNRALLEVKGEIVAFTDDDVIVDPWWLSRLVETFQGAPQVACVTGMILPLEMETPAQAWIEQFGGFGKGFSQRSYGGPDYHPQSPLYPYAAGTFGSGANMAFRTVFLREVGGFDPALGAGTPAMGGDDLAVFFEILSRGYQLTYQPAAFLYHQHRREYQELRRQAYGYGVGLSAYLTKTLLDKPTRMFSLAARLPAGLAYLLSPRSPKNSKKSSGYPRELTRMELKGFLYGPLAYLRSRHLMRSMFAGKPEPLSGLPAHSKAINKITLP